MEPDMIIGMVWHFQNVEKERKKNSQPCHSMGEHIVRARNGRTKSPKATEMVVETIISVHKAQLWCFSNGRVSVTYCSQRPA